MEIVKSNSTALKVNNNMLTQWVNFRSTLHKLFVDPELTLAWIDLSFNDLRTIDEVLLHIVGVAMSSVHLAI